MSIALYSMFFLSVLLSLSMENIFNTILAIICQWFWRIMDPFEKVLLVIPQVYVIAYDILCVICIISGVYGLIHGFLVSTPNLKKMFKVKILILTFRNRGKMSRLLGKVRNWWMKDSSGMFYKQGKKTCVAKGMGDFKQEMEIRDGALRKDI